MPLLKKRTLEKAPLPEFLRDDEEVFWCEMTNEIFRDYDEFAERTILCNSMVWTCSMTGKAGLTYEEALQSENNAKKMLEDFPVELRTPFLYIASLTGRRSFGDMADDVFSYVKDRYFVGENVEACFSGNKWKKYHVLQVIAPSVEEVEAYNKVNGKEPEKNYPASLYKYDLEQLDSDDKDVCEKMIVDMSHIRRQRSNYHREKSKLFLKQYVEQSSEGIFVIKPSVIQSYGINNIQFSQIFDGPPPEFEKSKKKANPASNKKVRQETLAKFLSKNNIIPTNGSDKSAATKLQIRENKRIAHEQHLKEVEEQKEQRRQEKNLQKQKNLEIALKLREWYAIRDDLLLEDQKKLPNVTPVKCRIPDKYLGDALGIIEFVNTFSTLLRTKYYFKSHFSIEIMEKALTENRVNGYFVSLIIMLLGAIFNLHEEEIGKYKIEVHNIKESEIDFSEAKSYEKAIKLSTLCSNWYAKHLGMSVNNLYLSALTITEVLRLHLLTSGATLIESTGVRTISMWRGGWVSEDDPTIHFKLHNSHILKALSAHNVIDLPIMDKIKIVNCLINQLLTLKQIREEIENNAEKMKDIKVDIKNEILAEKKRITDLTMAKSKLNKELIEKKSEITDNNVKKEITDKYNEKKEKLIAEGERAKLDHEVLVNKLTVKRVEKIVRLGYDRAFRLYVKLKSIPGLFICNEGTNSGTCLIESVRNIPTLVGAEREVIMEHLHKIHEEMNSSDKENEPKDQPVKLNGHSNGLDNKMEEETCQSLLMCSGDPSSCPIHSEHQYSPWFYIKDVETLNELISSLNKRGARESELRELLEQNYEGLVNIISKTPVLDEVVSDDEKSENAKKQSNEQDNLGYPYETKTSDLMCTELIESILHFEEKINRMGFGVILKDRDEWRQLLTDQKFEMLDLTIPEIDFGKENEKKEFKEPGYYLTEDEINCNHQNDEDSDDGDDFPLSLLELEESHKEKIKFLSKAILKLASSIKPAYFYRPLGNSSRRTEVTNVKDNFKNWALMLLNATSYSQLFLSLGTLTSSVAWRKGISACMICRKTSNPPQMLLCDSCNKAHHIYCLKPKLTEIPEGEWFCSKCAKERVEEKSESVISSDVDEDMREPTNCIVCDKIEGGQVLFCVDCSDVYHFECVDPPLKRPPRGKWKCYKCKEFPVTIGKDEPVVAIRRSHRQRDEADDLPLHNVALQELLGEVMKHPDSWAFITPVQKKEVPDYYDVISKPMDFGTVKYKLNMGEYKYDEEFMADALLIFDNCNTYNNTKDEVYQCGMRLLRFFVKKSKELHLKPPASMEVDDDDDDDEDDAPLKPPKTKKRRTK